MDNKLIFLISALILITGCEGGITGLFIQDATPPVITITQTTVTPNSAFISWSTDKSANSTFNSSIIIQNYDFATEFNITLNSLNENTTYSYIISACDNSSYCSSVASSFTTNSTPDTAPPVISISTETSQSTANITWTTDENANSTFVFNSASTDYSFATSFEKKLTGLNPGTQYSFTIIFCDASANCNTTSSQFTTQQQSDTSAPSISISSTISSTAANISWTTSESANSTIVFNGTSTYYDFASSFAKQLTGLSPGTSYQASITACDSSRNCNTQTHSFTTSAQLLNLSVINEQTTHSTAIVNWTTAQQATSSFRYSNVMITYSANTKFSASLIDLLQNSTYIYNVSACAGSYCNSLLDNFTTQAVDSISPSLKVNFSYTHNSANFNWTANENVNSTFRFNSTVSDYGFAASFSKTLTGLTPITAYEVNITVCDSGRNCNSTLVTFTTLPTPDTTQPIILISSMQAEKNSAAIAWTTDESSNCTFYLGNTATHYTFNTAFSRSITSLEPGTVYNFNITACDNSSNCASTSSSFTTKPAEITPPQEPTIEMPASQSLVQESAEETEEETIPKMGGLVIQPPPETKTEELTFFGRIKKLTSDHLLLIILSLILTLTIVFNISYLKITKSPSESATEDLINRANWLIQNRKIAEAYQLYPRIMSNYNKVENSQGKGELYKKLSFLHSQLQLHTALMNAESLAEQYYNGQLNEDYVPLIMQHLDKIPSLLEQLKSFLPKEHHQRAHKAIMDRHSRCLTRIYQKKKNSNSGAVQK